MHNNSAMEITCRAKTTLWHPGFREIYSCNIIKSDLRPLENKPITFHLTYNEIGKTDSDVEVVVFLDSKIYSNFNKNLRIDMTSRIRETSMT